MLPSAACWPAIQVAAACAAANCGIWGWTDAAPAGAAKRRQGGGAKQGGQADSGSTQQGAAEDVHGSRFPDLDPENSATTRGRTEPQSLCLDGGNSSDLEVSRLMASPRAAHHSRLRTSAGFSPASPLGQYSYSIVLPAYGTTQVPAQPARTRPRCDAFTDFRAHGPPIAWQKSEGKPLSSGALAMLAARPAARPTQAFFQLLLGPANAAFSGLLLLGILNPADELVAGQRRDVLPCIESRRVGDQRLAQVSWKLVHHATGHPLATHTAKVAGRGRQTRQ